MGDLLLPPKTRFLLVRPDNIGDVILTLPSVTSLRAKYPESFIAYLCRSYTAPLLEKNSAVDQVITVDGPGVTFPRLVEKIRSAGIDIAIHFYLDSSTVMATRLAGVPVRIGPRSKPAALFLSQRVVQNRSRVQKHEAEYNWDLVRVCGADQPPASPVIFLTEDEKKRGRDIISYYRINPDKPPILIHPGSKGSASSWPLEHFLRLSQEIAERFGDVLFSGGQGEEKMIDRVMNLSQPPHPYIHAMRVGSLTLRELAAVISQSRLVLSNSTGPLHMAVSLGVPTISFYPHVPLTTSARRWGPFGNPEKNSILSPESPALAMSSISVESALDSVGRMLEKSPSSARAKSTLTGAS